MAYGRDYILLSSKVATRRGYFAKLGEVGLRGRDEIANQLSLAASSDLLYAIVLK